MENDFKLTDENKKQFTWLLLLYHIIKDISGKIKLSWNKLLNNENTIKDNEIATLLLKLKDSCEVVITPNQKFYRAREYKNCEIKEIYNKPFWKELFHNLETGIPEFFRLNLSFSDIESIFDNIILLKNVDTLKGIIKAWAEKNKNERFWGFDVKNSGRNRGSDKEGRLNKSGEHHLYLAYDIDTAISEIRPINQQQISVATINIKKELKIFDLTKTFEFGDGTKDGDYFAFYQMAQMCSMPNFNDKTYYKPTQKISSYIKELGFDGIIYPSALRENGKNILIYDFGNQDLDDEYFEIISTDVYIASNVINATKVLPLDVSTDMETLL